MDKIDLLNQIIFIIIIILVIITMFYFIGTQVWEMQILKNECIAQCIELNKINPLTCVC